MNRIKHQLELRTTQVPVLKCPEYLAEGTELALCAFHAADVSTGSEGSDHREYDMNHLVEKPSWVIYIFKESVLLLNVLK